ncbi:hypothetical protein AbraCBS73388_003155 [Aspergillus brasiliensis]|uniref:Isochorismatase-like domain-containing protein n=1 Tax=Aspergillus brasiliensis TaxID=319629 RepID=A0A9W5YZT9_9EURO|nr:hypothetical protein AbraCBS73388_003155 [Aspergillus brasiliensis]
MPRSAIFVIDIQKHLAVDPETRVPQADRVIKASEEILQTARSIKDSNGNSSDPLIVFVQHEETPNDGALVKGTEPWELVFHPRAEVEGDTFKSNRDLAQRLRDANVTEIVAFGIQSDACVEATCTGALAAGFHVTVLAGAHSTYDADGKTAQEIEREVELRLSTRGARVVRWEKAIAKWVEKQQVA